MLPATRGAEVLYINVIRPVVGNVKTRVQAPSSSASTTGFNPAGTTAPSSFEREYTNLNVVRKLTSRREDPLSARTRHATIMTPALTALRSVMRLATISAISPFSSALLDLNPRYKMLERNGMHVR